MIRILPPIFLLLSVAALRAATFTVTNSNDSGAGSLRQAVLNANNTAVVDTIVFDTAGHFSVPRTITLTSGEIRLEEALTLNGPSAAGQRVTVRGELYVSGQSTGATIRNLTVREGSPGIAVAFQGVLTMEGCTVTECTSYGVSNSGTLSLVNTVISGNTPSGLSAGGTVTLTGCQVVNNTAGISSLGNVTATDTTVAFNTASGVVHSGGALTLTRCLVTGNTASGYSDGGGLVLEGGLATLRDCTFSLNSADSGGGVMAEGNSILTAEGCTFFNNSADGVGEDYTIRGGALYLTFDVEATLTNCTISGNRSNGYGGAVYAWSSGLLRMYNCTVTANESVSGPCVTVEGSAEVGNCLIAGNTGGDIATYAYSRGSIVSLGGNLIGRYSGYEFRDGVARDQVGSGDHPLDPRLGPLQDNGGETTTHALLLDSPAIEGGKDSLVTTPPFTGPQFRDQRGQPRTVGGRVDCGAYEFPALEVTNVGDAGTGTLRSVLSLAEAGGGVITFRESVFGASRQTILLTSGQIGITSEVMVRPPEVGVTISGNDASRILNITAGAKVTLDRVHFLDGNSTADGGAVRVAGATTDVLMRECSVVSCRAAGGGGMTVEGGTVTATDSSFRLNVATASGGAFKIAGGTLRLTNSTVSTNNAGTNGGGLSLESGAATLVNATVTNNTADVDVNNTGNGGGIFRAAGTMNLGNTIVAANVDLSSGTSHPDLSGTFTSLGHNRVGIAAGSTGLTSGTDGDLLGTAGTPLNLQLTAQSGGIWYLPAAASPAVDQGDNLLLERNAWPAFPALDQRGQTRIYNAAVDIGAAEAPSGSIVTMELPDARASEHGAEPAKLRLYRSFTAGPLTVTINRTAAGTAAASDFTLSGPGYAAVDADTFTLTFPDGDDTITLTLTPTADSLAEGQETVVLTLAAGSYSTDPSAVNTHTVTILDEEFLVTSNASTGPGSLREAINDANDTGGGKIVLATGMNITLRGSPLHIESDIEIIGNVSTISAAGRSRVFEITGDGGGCVKLQGLIIAGGSTTSNGGGIYADRSCVELRGCSLTLNKADGYGGAIYAKGRAPFTIVNSAIYENAALSGGGIAAETELGLTNVTIARNTALNGGGGVLYFGDSETATVTNCTITGNKADTDPNSFLDNGGGGLYCPVGTVLLRNTVVSGNTDATFPGSGFIQNNLNITGGTFQTAGGNFIADNNGVTGLSAGSPNAGGDYVGTAAAPLNPRLIAQPDLRPFYAFPPASLLAGRGINANNSEPNDQRGRPRITGGTIDIGAVEMSAFMVTINGDSGTGTLRKAIADANAAGGGDILLDEVFFNGSRNIAISSGELVVTSPVDIMAPSWPSAAQVQIGVSGTGRVMKLAPAAAASITLRQVRLYGGNTTTNAAGDRNGGVLLVGANSAATLLRCELENGTSPSDGGLVMVAANASLTARDTSMSSGSANRGGIIASSGALNLERCLIRTGNSLLNGGGIFNSGTATLLNCSLQSNSAAGSGGAVFHAGGASPLTLAHCTLYFNRSNNDNSGSETGGGIRQFSGPVSLRNTLLVENFEGNGSSALRADLAGAFTSSGFNLISSTGSATGFTNGVNGDQTGTTSSPLPERVGLSTDNGGPTITNALRGDSLCLDAGDDTGAPATDQRGLLRRYGSGVDIGAYELQPETYGFWATHAFPANAADTAPGSDYDGDGVLNEIEYATGSDPGSPRSRPVINVILAGTQCHFDYPASVLAPTGYLRLRLSPNLNTWNDAPAAVSQGFDAVTGLQIWRVTVNLAAFPKRFARLER